MQCTVHIICLVLAWGFLPKVCLQIEWLQYSKLQTEVKPTTVLSIALCFILWANLGLKLSFNDYFCEIFKHTWIHIYYLLLFEHLLHQYAVFFLKMQQSIMCCLFCVNCYCCFCVFFSSRHHLSLQSFFYSSYITKQTYHSFSLFQSPVPPDYIGDAQHPQSDPYLYSDPVVIVDMIRPKGAPLVSCIMGLMWPSAFSQEPVFGFLPMIPLSHVTAHLPKL